MITAKNLQLKGTHIIKKLLIFTVTAAMLLSFAACSQSAKPAAKPDQPAQTETADSKNAQAETAETENVQIPNPWTDYDSKDDAVQAAGFDLTVPDKISGCSEKSYRVLSADGDVMFDVNFFAPGVSFLQIIFLEFMVNIRHVFYGLSLIEKFRDMGKKKLYMIFSLTDETYSLFFITKVPEGVDEHKFLFSIALLDQLYWIIGSAIGAIAGTLIPFDTTGIDFAMTALFVVIFVEQWLTSRNHLPALTGIAASLICLLIFGSDNFILPSMICIMIILLSGRKVMEEKEVVENAD